MSKTSKILKLFRTFRVTNRAKCYHFANHFRVQDDKNICRTKYGFSNNGILNSFVYFTFIGLGAKNANDIKKKEEEMKKEAEWEREKEVSQHIAMAELAIKKGEINKAEFILQNAIKLSEAKATVGITCAYDMLATLAYRKGNILKARDILVKVINHLTNTGMPSNHDSVIEFRLKLARILSKLGSSKEAEEHFKECLEIEKWKCQVDSHNEETEKLWINTLYWYGKHLSNHKKYSEAKNCFDNAYKLSARTKSIDNSQVMVILFDLSEMSYMGGEKDEALRYLLSAVTLGRLSTHPDLATYYTRIGMIYLSKGLLSEARRWCEDGIEKGKRFHNRHAQLEGESCLKQIKEFLRLHQV